MRIVLAPDKYKGCRSAPEIARAMAAGAQRALSDAETVTVPLADGGDGTIDALVASAGGEVERVNAHGPLGDPVEAALGWLPGGTAVVEMAAASGLALVPEGRRDALRASSRGVGEVIAAALERRASGGAVLVGLGGSASTDGGAGAAAALGWRFLDRLGRELPPGGGALRELAAIDGRGVHRGLRRSLVRGASDVDNPLLGPRGAARVFGPQKGATGDQVAALEEGLERLADRIRADLGVDVAERWGAGACGGIGAGLIAFLGAELAPGFDIVAEAAGLSAHLEEADLVITGEGRLDEQSLGGKTPVGVARLAGAAGVTCAAVAGEVAVERARLEAAGFALVASLTEAVGRERALAETDAAVAEVTAELVARLAG